MKKAMKKYLHAITLEMRMARVSYARQYKKGYMTEGRKYEVEIWSRTFWKMQAIQTVAFVDSELSYKDCILLMKLCNKLRIRIDSCYSDCQSRKLQQGGCKSRP